jgi:hypothetical protein
LIQINVPIAQKRESKGMKCFLKTIGAIIIVALSLAAVAGSSAQTSASGQTDRCWGEGVGRKYTADTKADSYENAIAAHGKKNFYSMLALSMKSFSSCLILRNDPEEWSDSRMLATLALDSALPIAVVGTDASEDCDSALVDTFRHGCGLSVDLRIENKTDDMTFTHVAVACLGQLTTSKNIFRLANVQYEPIKASGPPLGPHDTQDFRFWYGAGHLNIRFTSTQIIKGGGVRWCHVLAAHIKPLPGLSEATDELVKNTRIEELRRKEQEQAEVRGKQNSGAADDCPRIRQSAMIDFAIARATAPQRRGLIRRRSG